ncbi:hypothetical protein [endosymbiont GvMRE of Glomus versiforme]|uniref:hypothetical protein n=1 Tax=endosymbiont GvMRE of Glomus versiforme TaxID=2039283 RepID=UPI000EED36B8|nr:hypothetical protein [endosymbiont GvMRE of Glomus versiforme]RHZ37175.1 hypothetical protein GvMRE_I1g470 [endosymbiont GvMRE of Glomus versiforme]
MNSNWTEVGMFAVKGLIVIGLIFFFLFLLLLITFFVSKKAEGKCVNCGRKINVCKSCRQKDDEEEED